MTFGNVSSDIRSSAQCYSKYKGRAQRLRLGTLFGSPAHLADWLRKDQDRSLVLIRKATYLLAPVCADELEAARAFEGARTWRVILHRIEALHENPDLHRQ